jgi:hypothetical protein
MRSWRMRYFGIALSLSAVIGLTRISVVVGAG